MTRPAVSFSVLLVLSVTLACQAGSEASSDRSVPRVVVRSADGTEAAPRDGAERRELGPREGDPEIVVLGDAEPRRTATPSHVRARRERAEKPTVIYETVVVREPAPSPRTEPAPEPEPEARPEPEETPVEVASVPTTEPRPNEPVEPERQPRPAPDEGSTRVEDAAVGAAIGAGIGAVLGGTRGAIGGAVGGAVGGATGGRAGAVLGGVLGGSGSRGGRLPRGRVPGRRGGC